LLFLAALTVSVLWACSVGVVEVQQAADARDCGLLEAQLGRKEPWLVEEAASGLGMAGCGEAAGALTSLMSDGDRDERVRVAAGVALSRLGRLEAAPLLVEELSRASHPEARYALVTALGRLCTREAVGALEGAVADGDIYVSRAARKGLARCAAAMAGGGAP